MTNCICEQPDYEGQAKSNGGWDKGCPVHGDPEPEGDFVGIGRNGAVSPKAAEAPGGREREENRLAGQVFTEVYGSRPEAGHPLLKAVRRALRDYRNYVLTVAAPAADEREKFKKWAVPKPWYTPAIFAYGEKEGEFADALVQEFWECWRAGLSSQEGK